MLSWNPRNPFKQETSACVHELFEARTRNVPTAEAICSSDGSVTYEELDRISNMAAARLLRKGVRIGTYIPFAYEKSSWAVVAILGILKAGAALVPLNPNDPLARLEEILGNLNADVVVTTQNFVAKFEPLVMHVIVISQETITDAVCDGVLSNGASSHEEDFISRVSVSPSDPIFVLFTSGSTGRPKGMIHTHKSIATHALTHGAAMFYHGARVLQFAAYTFDVALIDIFTTLLFGGCICVPSESDRRSNIIRAMNSMRVDHAILTPSFAGLIDPSEVPMLKTLAVGGEPLPQDRIRSWAGKVDLLQIYGPAEAGICMIKKMQYATPGAVIGYPIANTSCWLVDPEDVSRLVPIGAIGELVVAGPSLALGYLNDEARTQLSFVHAPSWATSLELPCKQFYKTGDLLRYDVDAFDGSFIFAGRKDTQIKLRGQRIEAGEVEYHIGHLPQVAFVMVTKPDKGCFSGALVAVVQMRDADKSRLIEGEIRLAEAQDLTLEDVRLGLQKVLPAYMIPSECLAVCNMPFVPSMKIDRRRVSDWLAHMESRPSMNSIPIIDLLSAGQNTAYSLSKRIPKLLALDDRQSLRLEAHDFRLQDTGIDSIKMISLSMFLQREYGITVPTDVLMNPQATIRGLADWIDTQTGVSTNVSCSVGSFTSIQPRVINPYQASQILIEALIEEFEAKKHSTSTTYPHGKSQNIFLTGASGYLGSVILRQLLKIPHLQVFILVRCDSPFSGLQKVIDIAKQGGWWSPSYSSRITVWPGDLSLPNLGLSTTHQQQLTPSKSPVGLSPSPVQIDTIIHAGAKVHYTLPYSTLLPINVTSTLDLLRFTAFSPHIHTFIHVSGGESPDLSSLSTEPEYLTALGNASGYTLTKNIAERVVRDAAGHPPPPSSSSSSSSHLSTLFASKNIQVVKPGYIIGSARSGFRANTSDFLWRLVAGCVEIGAYNAEEESRWVFIEDVERVATKVVGLIDYGGEREQGGKKMAPSPSPPGEQKGTDVQRVLSGLRCGTLWQVLGDVYGRRFEPLPSAIWMKALREKVLEAGEAGLLFPLLGFLEREGGRIGAESFFPEAGGTGGDCEEERMKKVVGGNVRWLIEVGFLPAVAVDGQKGRGGSEG